MIHFLPPERLQHVLLASVFCFLLEQKAKRLLSAKIYFVTVYNHNVLVILPFLSFLQVH